MATRSSSDKIEVCHARHPWWFGVRCELDANHKGNHEAKLDSAGHYGAKIKWSDDDKQ